MRQKKKKKVRFLDVNRTFVETNECLLEHGSPALRYEQNPEPRSFLVPKRGLPIRLFPQRLEGLFLMSIR